MQVFPGMPASFYFGTMKNFIIVSLILIFNGLSIAQDGYNRIYEMFEPGVAFHNVMLLGDTIVVTGNILDETTNQWGILFARFDTMGQLLDQRTFIDSLGDFLLLESNYDFLKTEHVGYLLGGVVFGRTNRFLLKLNEDGEKEWLVEYHDTINLSIHQTTMVENSRGFLLGGYGSSPNYFLDIFLMQVDHRGEVLWERYYGDTMEVDEVVYSMIKISENEYVVGCSRASSNNIPIEDQWAKSWLFAIDSLGEVLWEWESNEGIWGEIRVDGLQILPDGDWLYNTSEIEILDGIYTFFPKIVRRDSNLNLVWEREVEVQQAFYNNLEGILPLPNNNYLGFGYWYPDTLLTDYPFAQHGCLYKVDEDGEMLWTSCHRREWGVDTFSREYLAGAVALPSGSIIAAGRSDRSSPSPGRSYGWLIKVDSEGCIDTLCRMTTGVEGMVEVLEGPEVRVYPNPAREVLTFRWEEVIGEGTNLQMFSVDGSRTKMMRMGKGQREAVLDVDDLPNGIYFYQISSDRNLLHQGKIIIHR